MINPNTIERIREANPVPDADLLHREPAEAAGLFSSIERRRDTMLGTKLQRPTPPLPPLTPWYRRPAPVFIAAAIIAVAVIVPVAVLGGSGTDVADEPSAPEATTVAPVTTAEAPVTSTAEAPATTTAPTTLPPPEAGDYDWVRVELDAGPFPEGARINAVTYNESVFLAVGSNADNCAQVWLSSGGSDWEPAQLTGPVSPCGGGFTDLAFKGPIAVAIGDGPVVWVSENGGNDWSQVPSNETPFSSGDWLSAVAASDMGFVVASGYEDCSEPECFWGSAISFSPDGRQWTEASAPVTERIVDITAGPGGFIATAEGGSELVELSGSRVLPATVLHSPDGAAWSLVAALGGTGVDDTACFVAPNSITHGPAGYVIAGDCVPMEAEMAYSSAWRSDDGVTWTQVPYDEAAFGDPAYITSIAADERGYVAAGSTLSQTDFPATVWFSEDGLSWTRTELHEEGNSGVSGVAVHDGTAVAVGDDQGEPAIWIGARP